jgi:hypothetical protein
MTWTIGINRRPRVIMKLIVLQCRSSFYLLPSTSYVVAGAIIMLQYEKPERLSTAYFNT